ncbi:LADA_0E01596g1_1 [Lachancea dasiensis]|uniref:LADA_0E01596g1_1 n=1 Tax=Lachancea dasiensis TaxID=1072105 RepID=A0A1G4JAK5_9SACH|nr:LADA_0E01596g1_1 [Lachancea dasiensis]
MSLIVYGDKTSDEHSQKVVLHDSDSRSLVVINPQSGEISLLRQVRGPSPGLEPKKTTEKLISSYFCPQCGSEVGTRFDFELQKSRSKSEPESGSFVHRNYFKLLEQSSYRGQQPLLPGTSVIPLNLFTPGYYRRFFRELSLLGSGARGSVYKVEHVLMDNHLGVYALKKIHIGNDLTWLELGMKEVKFLSALTHSSVNLITYNHVWLEMDTSSGIIRARDGKDTGSPEQIPCIFILQKFCPGGNLEEVVLKKVFDKLAGLESSEERKKRFRRQREIRGKDPRPHGLTTSQLLSIIYDIASGLKELHEMNIIHRDLKPSNCLLAEPFEEEKAEYGDKCFPNVIISDFGESQIYGQMRSATGATGTLEFTAPEVIILPTGSNGVAQPQFSFKSDMYSLGMLSYFLIFGALPFSADESLSKLKHDIISLKVDKDSLISKHEGLNLKPVDSIIFSLIAMLLDPNPTARPSAAQVKTQIGDLMQAFKLPASSTVADSSDVSIDDELDSEADEISEHVPTAPQNDRRRQMISNILLTLLSTVVTILIVYFYNNLSYLPCVSAFLFGFSLRSEQHTRKFFLFVLSFMLLVQFSTS